MSAVNIPAVLIADSMGIVMLICVVIGNMVLFKEQAKRNKYLVMLLVVTIISCVSDAVSFLADGKSTFIVYLANTVLFLCAPTTAVCWIFLVVHYIKVRLSKLHRAIIFTFFCFAVGLILANLVTPHLFEVVDKVYHRTGNLFVIYSVSYFALLGDVLVLYLFKRYDSGGIKFFPIWAYLAPIAMGMSIQTFYYGVSTIGPFMAIAITAITISFQNSLLFKDQLTDLYNRYYLAQLQKRLGQKSGKNYSVIMLDVNDFKSINDLYGHDVGDEALVQLSKILISVVDKSGEVIRYAGDEFIVVLNSRDEVDTQLVIEHIEQSLDEFNQNSDAPYKLSVAIGWCRFDEDKTLNDFITEADKRMYDNKQQYYDEKIAEMNE